MKRSHYTTGYFLRDREFVSWVKQPTPEKDRYWQLWMEAHPGSREAMLEARELILSMKFQLPGASQEEKLSILKNVLKAGGQGQRPGSGRWPRLATTIKTAAAIALLIASAYVVVKYLESLPQPQQLLNIVTVKEVAKGARMQIKLPDGSRVWINSGSQLSYDTTFNYSERAVTLVGEAFFEVTPDTARPFMVKSGSLITTALGTSFNIKAFANEPDIEVSLVTGKAGVKAVGHASETVVLEPGEQVVALKEEKHLEKQPFDYEEEIGWKDGLLYFQNASYGEIKRRLERWYGITIHTEDATGNHFSNWNYTGKFENQSLEMVLKRMGFTKDFIFSISNQEIYLYPKN